MSTKRGSIVDTVLTLLILVLLGAPSLGAQESGERTVDRIFAPEGTDFEDYRIPRTSAFDLAAIGDEGAQGVRRTGITSWCLQNIVGGLASRFNVGCDNHWTITANGLAFPPAFDDGMWWGAPATDMPDVISFDDVEGGGYTVNMTTLIISGFVRGGGEKLWASDRSAAELLNLAARTTDDGSCTDHTAFAAGDLDRQGEQLTPSNQCPQTIPATGWGGRRPIPAESYLTLQATSPDFAPSTDTDPFAFWRVPEELQQTGDFLGDWTTYGETNDWWLEALGRYGKVIPGGSGAPEHHGWPLGLSMFYDGFYFGLPTVSNTLYIQATIVNDSERVYGVGFEYDSVYIGVNYDPLTFFTNGNTSTQSASHFVDPNRNTVAYYEQGAGCTNSRQPPVSCDVPHAGGFDNGAIPTAYVLLKSPIGDMRNELFSDPGSDFFDPSHPRAGDTITFQHQRQCGFGSCLQMSWSRGQRAFFGLVSSTGSNLLDGRTPGELDDSDYWLTFRTEDWPDKTGEFNKYVPGADDSQPMWDWNHDGVADTIYADGCGRNGCAAFWSDTLPGGLANTYGNISHFGVGPVHVAPGDTVGWTLALVGAADSASIERNINNTIDFYKAFYLGPSAATPPVISAVDVVPGGSRNNQITLFFDDSPEEFRDPFFNKLIESIPPEQLDMNPWLPDSIRGRQENNLAAIHIFKSCDGGSTFTDDNDCDGDPVGSVDDSKFSGFGWAPFATIEADPDGRVPNTFEDQAIIPGVTYTYSIVTETRGMQFGIVEDDGSGGNVTSIVELAPPLLSGLATSSNVPSVAIVYAPLNLAAGASLAELDVMSRTGFSSVPVDFDVVGSAPTGGRFTVKFADSIVVITQQTLDGGDVVSTSTSVIGMDTEPVTVGGTTEQVAIETFTLDRTGSIAVQGFGPAGSGETATSRTDTVAGGFGLVVYEGNTPLMASVQLDGDNTTPGTFFGQEDFPFFVVRVDEGDGGDLDSDIVFRSTADGDSIANRVRPTIVFLDEGSTPSRALDESQFGVLEISWADAAFPRSPYRINDPDVTDLVLTSIEGRTVASQSSTDPELLAAVRAADPSVTTAAEDLVAMRLPFTVRNQTYGRPVTTVVTRHPESIVIGRSVDTLRIDMPDDLWVPGDVMYFIEDVPLKVRDDNGNVVLGADGRPLIETTAVATFKVNIGCTAPRDSCDPVVGGDNDVGYIPFEAGFIQRVDYLVPLQALDEVTVEITPAVAATDAAPGTIDLNGVHVVPNPYLFASEFERNTADRVLRFTSVPPEGRIRIFDIAGRFVQEINYVPDDLRGGDLDWNLQTRESLEVAAGLYVFVLETPDGDRTMGKFVVIR